MGHILDYRRNRIFVFGSNLAGRHGKGAALHAKVHYGAIYGVAIGHAGHSYAIPTKDRDLISLTLGEIELFVKGFKAYALENPKLEFNITQIGCGLAGYSKRQIGPMFERSPANCWFDTKWMSILGSSYNYWHPPI